MLLEDVAVAVRGQTPGNVAYAFANQSGDWGNFDFPVSYTHLTLPTSDLV